MKKFILASQSPRRKEILEKAGYEFSVFATDVDENIGVDDPQTLVRELSMLKACDAAKRINDKCIVIGADTVVSIDGRILGKPKSEEDAKNMLKTLSGRVHAVYTGVCVVNKYTGVSEAMSTPTYVTFKKLCDEEIDSYVKSGEPMDKAGAYAIQGGAKDFVLSFDGELDNVIGFPMKLFEKILSDTENAEG